MQASVICVLLFILHLGQSSRILAAFPHNGKSHFSVFEPYLQQLAARGHRLLVLSHFPREKPLHNYEDIDLRGILQTNRTNNILAFQDITYGGQVRSAFRISMWGSESCEKTLQHPVVQDVISSNQTFDLLLAEPFCTDCFLAFAHKFKIPIVGFSSCSFWPWVPGRVGNPDNLSYVPMQFATSSDRMNFRERFWNTFWYLFHRLHHPVLYDAPHYKIARKYFGESLPPLSELAMNTSLILVNDHFSLNRPRPLVPGVVQVGGIHIRPKKDLSQQLAARGHRLLVLSHFPREKPLHNYEDIDLRGILQTNRTNNILAFQDITYGGQVRSAFRISMWGSESCEKTLQHPVVQDVISSNQTFDLLLAEPFCTDCFLAFAHKFKIPIVGFSSCSFWPWVPGRVGNPDNLSYVPMQFATSSDRMNFRERFWNTFWYLFHRLHHPVLYDAPHYKIARKYFGESLPPLSELAMNTSLILVNDHFSLNRPRPLVPGVVQVGGIHIRPKKDLSQLG
ncbi:UDP-glucosyltransferase 2-like [Periplaneta americana]|uniref:UDP-glucosyltransferase 2-like n=1 Tax=Periplaneta americana TaxID=6978 RepID=UPI0037E7CEBB